MKSKLQKIFHVLSFYGEEVSFFPFLFVIPFSIVTGVSFKESVIGLFICTFGLYFMQNFYDYHLYRHIFKAIDT